MMSALFRSLCPLFLAAAAGAQVEPIEVKPYEVDSGPRDNPSLAFTRVFSQDIVVPAAVWLQVHFSESVLPLGSQLRLTSAVDGAQQLFDAVSLEEYSGASAIFNGGRVLVELLAGPRTVGNRIVLNELEYGTSLFLSEDSLCGLGDERKLSNDPRVARAHSSGCTIWLINEHTFITAGHCAGAGTTMAHFNVPLSSSSGERRFPPPSDQYALDLSTLRKLDGGVGQDWAVVSSVRNSNTHLYAGQKQGWFQIGDVAEQVFPSQPIRVTGYGSVSRPVSLTWNWVQKTHLGQATQVDGEVGPLHYRTDTTDGNSGSPVIMEETGMAVGIHTHGDCDAFGGDNLGTRIDLAELQTAISEVAGSRVAGGFSLFGEGCPGTFGSPRLSMAGIADIDRTLYVTVLGITPGSVGALLAGFSDSSFGGHDLPMAMDLFGMEGCTLYVSADIHIPVPTGFGVVSLPIAIPNDPSLVELETFLQFVGPDAGAGNILGAVASNAARVIIGG